MEGEQIHTISINKYGEGPVYTTKIKPVPKEGELLVKVEAATINPSDKARLTDDYEKKPLPFPPGYEGVGRVIEAKGADFQKYVGKRVCFIANAGSWAEYTTTPMFFEIEDDVPVSSAASGVVNPLTVLAMIYTVKAKKHTGSCISTWQAAHKDLQDRKHSFNKYC
jgi:NADPH:quinone reductase-like Zn-dependent oxidoreductase